MGISSGQIIYEVYGNAMFQLAQETGQVERTQDELIVVAEVLRGQSDFVKLLMSDTLRSDEKRAIIQRVFGDRVSPLSLHFLYVLSRRNRMGFLAGIADFYEVLADGLKNCQRVEVTLAKSLPGEQLEQLRLKIKDAIQAEVKLKVNIDPGILGGMVLRQGDIMIDNSARTVLGRTVNMIMDRSKEKLHKLQQEMDEKKP
jgi:F-type H+-transporting ATPase subunit delta